MGRELETQGCEGSRLVEAGFDLAQSDSGVHWLQKLLLQQFYGCVLGLCPLILLVCVSRACSPSSWTPVLVSANAQADTWRP